MAKRRCLLGMFLGVAMGCATVSMPSSVAPVVDLGQKVGAHEPVQGPGAVFETIDEAAVDGLAWCYLRSKGEEAMRVRGGTVRPVQTGGYGYEEIVTAPAINPYQVSIRVKPTDVAYFIHVPGPDSLEDKTHSRVHRANVDERDPLHRPSYLLTPRLNVQVYHGEGDEELLAVLDRTELREMVRRAERR